MKRTRTAGVHHHVVENLVHRFVAVLPLEAHDLSVPYLIQMGEHSVIAVEAHHLDVRRDLIIQGIAI